MMEYKSLLSLLLFCITTVAGQSKCQQSATTPFYSLSYPDLTGNPVSLSKYKGHVTLVVNVATFWGGTTPTYTQANTLLASYGGNSKCALRILAFPSAQFMNQEPGKNAEILNGLKYVRPGNGYVPKLDMFAKVNVNGDKEIPLFTWLKKSCPRPTDTISSSNSVSWQPIKVSDIQWNFEKFLIDHHGNPIKRYQPSMTPLQIKNDITTLISKCQAEMYWST